MDISDLHKAARRKSAATREKDRVRNATYWLSMSPEQREAYNANRRNRRQHNGVPARERERKLLRKYGISLADYDAMRAEQSYQCAICGCPEEKAKEGCLHVDHDHNTGRVRGLLCEVCNLRLPWVENGWWVNQAQEYLNAE